MSANSSGLKHAMTPIITQRHHLFKSLCCTPAEASSNFCTGKHCLLTTAISGLVTTPNPEPYVLPVLLPSGPAPVVQGPEVEGGDGLWACEN
jgi:hypothetical protein